MALTIKPVDRHGKLEVQNDSGHKIGTGRAVKSETHLGYVTLTIRHPDVYGIQVIRVPADWIAALEELE